jgi:outer membrane protein TolC
MTTQRIATALALGLILAGAGALPAQDRLTLKESVDLILKNSPQVRIAAESVTGAELKITETKSQSLPQVTVTGNYTRMSLFGQFQIPFNGQLMTIKFGTPNNYNFRASVMEQVFNWGRTARAIEVGKAGRDLAQDGEAMTRQMLSYQAVPLYYGTLFFREAIKVVDDNLQAFRKKLEILTERYEAGLVSSFDANLIKVQISTLEGQRADFANSIEKFRIAFNSLAGRDPAAAFEPAEELRFEAAVLRAEDLVREALAGRVEFQQAQHQADLGRASLELARTADKPTVVASFNYEFRNGFMPEIDKIRGNWTALLSVNYPLFDGGRTGTQVAEARSSLNSVELRRTELERQVALEIQTGLADLLTIERKLEIEKAKIGQSEEALRIAEERYQKGLLSATDLIDAQNALESARLNSIQLVYGHVLGKFNVYRSTGRIL